MSTFPQLGLYGMEDEVDDNISTNDDTLEMRR